MKIEFLESEIADSYYSLAAIEAAMNYYNLCQRWSGDTDEENDMNKSVSKIIGGEEIVKDINKYILKIYAGTSDENDKELLLGLRENIKKQTMSMMVYSDIFRLWEYVINRSKPVERVTLKDVNNDAVSRDILSAIFAAEDNPTINENIKFAVSQLPLRMTKGRFYDILEDGLKKYIGGEKAALEKGRYLIESVSGLYTSDESNESFDSLRKTVLEFENTDFSKVSGEEFERLEKLLMDTASGIMDSLEFYQSAEEVVNLLLVIKLNEGSVNDIRKNDLKENEPVIKEAVKCITTCNLEEMSKEVLDVFTRTEGKLEFTAEKLQKMEAKLDAAGRSNLNEQLFMSQILMSSSVFADFVEPGSETVQAEDADKAFKEIKEKFDKAFSEGNRMLNRARMCAALGELPVFFNSRTEVMNYVRESIDGCRDLFEKLVSVRLVMDAIGNK